MKDSPEPPLRLSRRQKHLRGSSPERNFHFFHQVMILDMEMISQRKRLKSQDVSKRQNIFQK